MTKIKNEKEIGRFIKERMEILNMKPIELAEKLANAKGENYNKNQLRDLVYKWLNGQRAPGIDYVFYLSQILQVSIEELLVAGEVCEKYDTRPWTLYAIAKSGNYEELDKIMSLELSSNGTTVGCNYDEYDKTILDYVIEFENIEMLKYMFKKEYIKINLFGIYTKFYTTLYDTAIQNKILSLAIKNDDLELFSQIITQASPIWKLESEKNDIYAKNYNIGFAVSNDIIKNIFSTNKIFEYLTTPYIATPDIWNNQINRGIFFLNNHISKNILNDELSKIERLPEAFNLLFDYALINKEPKLNDMIDIAIKHKLKAFQAIRSFYSGAKIILDKYGNTRLNDMYGGSLSMVGVVNNNTYALLNEEIKKQVIDLLIE